MSICRGPLSLSGQSILAALLGILWTFVLATVGGAVRAGDGAASNVFGFSADGRYFAFEQYGEEDGSGTIYSEIAAIDIATDRLVAGTPIVAGSREDAMKQAAALLRRLKIGSEGMHVTSVPTSRVSDIIPPKDMNPLIAATVTEISLGPGLFGADSRIVLRATDIDAPRCRELVLDGRPQGFVLTLERRDMAPVVLHRDRTLPRSRGCPDRYGLAGAYALRTPTGGTALAILAQYFYFAFEGHNRRFVAVTAHVPK